MNGQDKDGMTALMYAVSQWNSWQGSSDPELIDALLEAGADVNEKSEDGMTTLMFAAKDISAVNRLLQNGADVNAKDEDGMTVLMYATAHSSNYDVVSA